MKIEAMVTEIEIQPNSIDLDLDLQLFVKMINNLN